MSNDQLSKPPCLSLYMKRIVIVEDDPLVGMVYRIHLEKAGYKVHVAADGEAGWEAIQEDPPDAVLLDMMLPKISGTEILILMRVTPALSKVPVVIFTSALIPAMRDAVIQAGADRIFSKITTTPLTILKALTELFSSTEQQRMARRGLQLWHS